MENQTTQKWYQKPVTVILFLIFFFPVGLYLMWKNGLWSKTARIVVSVFFGLLILGNLGGGNSVLNKETMYEYDENGVYAIIYLIPKPEYGDMGKNSIAGDCKIAFRINGVNSENTNGHFVINEEKIAFDWEGIGPNEGIFKDNQIKVSGPEGIAIYKIKK